MPRVIRGEASGLWWAPRLASLLVLSALALTLVESAQLFMTAFDHGLPDDLAFELSLVSGALLLIVGLILGAGICVVAWALGPVWHRPRIRRIATLVALAGLVAACWALAAQLSSGAGVTRVLGSSRTLATIGLCAVLVATVLVVFFFAQALLRRRAQLGTGSVLAWAAGLFLAATLVHLANRRLYVGLYPEIHSVLALLTVLATVALMWWLGFLRAIPPQGLAVVWLFVLILSMAAGIHAHRALSTKLRLVSGVVDDTTFAKEALSLTWRALDFDSDGHSPFFGGGDCDDANAGAHPGAVDVPGNDIDEDCLGGDLPAPKESPPTVPAVARAKPADEALPDILFFSVDALRRDRLLCDGSSTDGAPTMSEVVGQGTCFANAYVTSTSSATSLLSIASGSYFSNVYPGVKSGGSASPRELHQVRTVLNDLADHGYQ